VCGQLLQRVEHAVAVARLVDPLLFQALEQLPAIHRKRVLETPLGHEVVERAGVDPDTVQGNPLTRRHEVVRGVAQRAAQLVQRGAQAGARAAVEHVRPDARREVRSPVRAGVQRQPPQQLARAPTGRRGKLAPVDLQRHLAEQPDIEHGRQRTRAPPRHGRGGLTLMAAVQAGTAP